MSTHPLSKYFEEENQQQNPPLAQSKELEQPIEGKADLHPLKQFFDQQPQVEEKSRGILEKGERLGQVAGSSFAAGLKALPNTAYRFLKDTTKFLGGNISELEEAEKNAPEFLKNFAENYLPSYEKELESQQQIPTYSGKEVAKPEGFLEKGTEKLGRFYGEGVVLGAAKTVKGVVSLVGMAAGMQYAEDAGFGPIGQLTLGVLGSMVPSGAKAAFSGIKNLKPSREKLAAGAAKLTNKDKLDVQKKIIENAREQGVTLDLGTMTDNNLTKSLQSFLSQSSLTGPRMDKLKSSISDQVVNQYKKITDEIGSYQFASKNEAAAATQSMLRSVRDRDYATIKSYYSDSVGKLPENASVYSGDIADYIQKIEKELTPGSLKSGEQTKTLSVLEELKKDVLSPAGTPKAASIKSLINNKIALNEILDFEAQGGQTKLLRPLVKKIDETIINQTSRTDPKFAKNYETANKKFASHAKKFRNETIGKALQKEDPTLLLNKMGTPHGVKKIKEALSTLPEGEQFFNDLSRFKVDELIFNNMVDGITGQVKHGQFSNLLKKKENRDLLLEMIGKPQLSRLENLMKNSANIAESSAKFFNASQSGVAVKDFVLASIILSGVTKVFSGNVWPLARSLGVLFGGKAVSKLISDPKFLTAVEDAILASKTGETQIMQAAARKLKEIAMQDPQLAAIIAEKILEHEENKENTNR